MAGVYKPVAQCISVLHTHRHTLRHTHIPCLCLYISRWMERTKEVYLKVMNVGKFTPCLETLHNLSFLSRDRERTECGHHEHSKNQSPSFHPLCIY